jgi:hypothetical protein
VLRSGRRNCRRVDGIHTHMISSGNRTLFRRLPLAQSKEAEPMIKASTAISLFLALGAVALAKQTPVER